MAMCETMNVLISGKPAIINKADFDKRFHEDPNAPKAAPKAAPKSTFNKYAASKKE
jgi:hypothetical protein